MTPGKDEGVGNNDESVDALLNKDRKGSFHFLFGASVQDNGLQPKPAGHRLHIVYFRRCGRTVRIQEHSDHGGRRYQLAEKLQPFPGGIR